MMVFIDWYTEQQFAHHYHNQEECIYTFTSYAPAGAFTAEFHRLFERFFKEQQREIGWLPLQNHMRNLCMALDRWGAAIKPRSLQLKKDRIGAQLSVGFHVRRGDMQQMLGQHGTHSAWAEEDESLKKTIQQYLDWNYLVWIATDDKEYYHKIKTDWFWDACYWGQICFNEDYAKAFGQSSGSSAQAHVETPLRMTNMQSFLDDITWLLSCDVIFGCRYSSVQFILKALVSDAQELKIVGCKMPKAFKTVPQKALHELEEFMAQQGAFIYQHIEYVVPQHNLERCQLHLLRQISAQNIMEAYDFVHQHWDGWSSEHKYYAQNSVLGQCELKTMLAPHVKAWKELQETLRQRNQSGFSHETSMWFLDSFVLDKVVPLCHRGQTTCVFDYLPMFSSSTLLAGTLDLFFHCLVEFATFAGGRKESG